MFDEIYWQENKGMFATINNKNYFIYSGFNDENEIIFTINKGFGNFINFDKNNNKDEYIYLLEKLSNYNITRFIYNQIIDIYEKLGIKHTMKKR